MGIQLQSEDNDCKCSHHGEKIIHYTYNCIPCLTSINKVCLSYFKYPVWIISEVAPPGIKALQGVFTPGLIEAHVQKTRVCFPFGSVCLDLHEHRKHSPTWTKTTEHSQSVHGFALSCFHSILYKLHCLCVCVRLQHLGKDSVCPNADGASHLLAPPSCPATHFVAVFAIVAMTLSHNAKREQHTRAVQAQSKLCEGVHFCLFYNNLVWRAWTKICKLI